MKQLMIIPLILSLTACGGASDSVDMPKWFTNSGSLSGVCGQGVAAMPHKRALSASIENSIAEAKTNLRSSFEVFIKSKLKRTKGIQVTTSNQSEESSSSEVGQSTIKELSEGGLKYLKVRKQEVRNLQVYTLVCIDAESFADTLVESYQTDNVVKKELLQKSRKILLNESKRIAAFTAKYSN